jgi:hypothetical protein
MNLENRPDTQFGAVSNNHPTLVHSCNIGRCLNVVNLGFVLLHITNDDQLINEKIKLISMWKFSFILNENIE